MKATSLLIALPALALSACEPQKPEAPIVKAPVQEEQEKPKVPIAPDPVPEAPEKPQAPPVKPPLQPAEEIGKLPLTMETLKVQVVKPVRTGEDAVWVEFQVKFSNKGKNHIALLNHPNTRRIELQNEAGKNVYPLMGIKHTNPTLLEVVRLEPGEEVTLNFSSLATSSKELGQIFKARMIFKTWSIGSMVPMAGVSRFREWPQQTLMTSWQSASTKDAVPRRELKGETKVEFLGVDCVPQGDPDLKGMGFRAKYRITNNSPKTIVHMDRPDGLGFVVSGSKGEYANPYAAMSMTRMSAWDAVVLGPGESKLCLVSTQEYTEPGMEKTVKVKFSIGSWDPKSIEGFDESGFPDYLTPWPSNPIQSPVYTVERRLAK